jgi:hypothetical protein
VLPREEVGRGEERPLPALERRRRQGPRRDGGLARADVALDEPEHRHRPCEVAADLVDRTRLVGGEAGLVAQLAGERCLERLADRPVPPIVRDDRRRACPSAGPPPRDHAQLEREQLVEGEAAERRVARLERRGVVGVLERLGDGRHRLLGAQGLRQVLRVGVARLVQRLAHRLPQAGRRQAGRQPVDRHDPADVEQVRRVRLLELGVVEHDPESAVLELARDDQLVARPEAALDEPAAEPGRLGRAGLVREERGRDLDPAPERLLDPDIGDPHAGRDDRAVLGGVEVVERPHLAQVVVPSREMEQEVAHGVHAEPATRPAEHGGGREPGQAHRLVEQLHRIGGDGRRDPGLERAAAPRGGTRPARRAAHSAEMRYR